MTLWYVNENFEMLKKEMSKNDEDMTEIMSYTDDETRGEMAKTLAAFSGPIMEQADSLFSKVPPVLQKAQEFMQQMQPPPQIPVDPNAQAAIQQRDKADTAKLQQKEISDQRKDAADQQRLQVDMASEDKRLAHEKELEFMKLGAAEKAAYLEIERDNAQAAQERIARFEEMAEQERAQDERTAAETASREQINRDDNQTALAIAAAEITSGEKIGLETGSGINPGN